MEWRLERGGETNVEILKRKASGAMHDFISYAIGVLSVGALTTAIKTWRDVALLKQDHMSSKELITRLTQLEADSRFVREAVSDIRENCVNCQRKI